MKFFADVKIKSKEIAILYAIIFIPMWSIFFINTFLMNDALNVVADNERLASEKH